MKAWLIALATIFLLSGCQQKMRQQPVYKPYAQSAFFLNGTSERPPVEGTVARGQRINDPVFLNGTSNGKPVEAVPLPITLQLLQRGRERYDIFCSPCHGYLGFGDGTVVARGFRGPASYHTDRLRQAPAGHFFDVLTNGFGAMAAYGPRMPVSDRWAIIAYIRALQLSQDASVDTLPPDVKSRLMAEGK